MRSKRPNTIPPLASALAILLAPAGILARNARTTACLCGDQRDALIAEYRTYNPSGYIPDCTDLTQNGRSFDFTFQQLDTPSPSQPNPTYSWALLGEYTAVCDTEVIQGLDLWVQYYGSSRTINSGYRCPSQNRAAGGVRNSQHQYGTAADLRNQSGTLAEWNNMVNAAKSADADYIEPSSLPCGTACTHADWRNHDKNYPCIGGGGGYY